MHTRPVRVVLDAMGGDHAPAHEVQGALTALQELGTDVELILVGRESDISPPLM